MAAKEKTVKEELCEYHDIMKKVRLLQFELGQIQASGENIPHDESSNSANIIATVKKNVIARPKAENRLQAQLDELLAAKNRLEYYVSLLDEDAAALIRAKYFEQYSWPDIVARFGRPKSTLYDCLTAGLETLSQMFEYVEAFSCKGI